MGANARAVKRAEVDRYLEALRPVLDDLADEGRLVGDPAAVAEVVAAVLPRPAPPRWRERIGPVYTTGQLQRLLPGVTRKPISDEAVRDRRRNGRLIGFKTADGRWAWPAFQFVVGKGSWRPPPTSSNCGSSCRGVTAMPSS